MSPLIDHDDPKHIYHPIFNRDGCSQRVCMDRLDPVWRQLLIARGDIAKKQEKLREWEEAAGAEAALADEFQREVVALKSQNAILKGENESAIKIIKAARVLVSEIPSVFDGMHLVDCPYVEQLGNLNSFREIVNEHHGDRR